MGTVAGFSQGTVCGCILSLSHTRTDLPATCSSRLLLHTPWQTYCDNEMMASLIKPHTDIDLIEQIATVSFHTLRICHFI